MTLQLTVYIKHLPAVRTMIWSYVVVHKTFMLMQMAGFAEVLVTQ